MGTTYKQSYNKKMKISEIFESLQGEGKYIGYPALFIRTSGCNRNCDFCFGVKKGRKVPTIICLGKNKKINEIKKGEKILTFDENQRLVITEVKEVLRRKVDRWLEIKINNKIYFVTLEHPFFTTRGLVLAKDLKVGDKILHSNSYEKISFQKRIFNPSFSPKDIEKRLSNPYSLTNYQEIKKIKSSKEHKKEVYKRFSERMKIYNPMKNKNIAKKVTEIRQKKIRNGELILKRTDEQRKRYSISKLGEKNPMKRPEVVHKNFLSHQVKKNISEKKFEELCIKNGIPVKFVGDGKLMIGYKYPDFIIDGTNKLIETYSGSYGYANGKVKRGKEWELNRINHFKKYGYECLCINIDKLHPKQSRDLLIKDVLNYYHNGFEVQSIKLIDRNDKKYKYSYRKPKELEVINLNCEPYNSFLIDYMWVHNCDTKYHKYGKEINTDEIIKRIKNSKLEIVVWTGGEPTLQIKEISDIINNTKTKKHHLETNGTNLTNQLINFFDYICISPKKLDEAKKSYEFREKYPDKVDVKVVTDFKENKDLIPYANILMPLERGIPKLDKELRKIMWIYCVNNNLRYSPRIQTLVWGYKKKGK